MVGIRVVYLLLLLVKEYFYYFFTSGSGQLLGLECTFSCALTLPELTYDEKKELPSCFDVTAEHQLCSAMFTCTQLTARGDLTSFWTTDNSVTSGLVTSEVDSFCVNVLLWIVHLLLCALISDHHANRGFNPQHTNQIPSSTKFWTTSLAGKFVSERNIYCIATFSVLLACAVFAIHMDTVFRLWLLNNSHD